MTVSKRKKFLRHKRIRAASENFSSKRTAARLGDSPLCVFFVYCDAESEILSTVFSYRQIKFQVRIHSQAAFFVPASQAYARSVNHKNLYYDADTESESARGGLHIQCRARSLYIDSSLG